MKKQVNKITPNEIYRSECTHTPIQFVRLNDLFRMNEIVSKVEIKNTDDGIYATIHFENSALKSTIKVITE